MKGGKVIGKGYNQRVQKGSAILHAEMDAFENAGRLSAKDYRECTLYSTLSPCDMCSGCSLLYKIPKIIIGENKTFKGPEDYLKSRSLFIDFNVFTLIRGVEIVVLNNEECIAMMEKFIKENPELWYEDIGTVLDNTK